MEAGFLKICSVGIPKFLEFSESRRVCLGAFDIGEEWGEDVTVFKVRDEFINIDGV